MFIMNASNAFIPVGESPFIKRAFLYSRLRSSAAVYCIFMLYMTFLQMERIMEAPSVTIGSGSHLRLKVTALQDHVAPIHRKARILTRDRSREAQGDNMALQVEDDGMR